MLKTIALITLVFLIVALLALFFAWLNLARELPGAESDPIDDEAEMWRRAFAGTEYEYEATRERK